MARIDTGYRPQPKQVQMHICAANEILFGGAAGPGKSHALRHEGLDWALRIPGLQVYLFRRTFPELEKNHILPSLAEFPESIGKYRDQKHRWEFPNGSMLHFCACQYEKDVFAYQGAEIHLLLIDELTTFSEFQYDYLRGRVRCTVDIPTVMAEIGCNQKQIDFAVSKIPGIVCASNPGGIGHEFAKRRWVDYAPPYTIKQATSEEGGMLRAFIPGLLEDNPILLDRDPKYRDRLNALPEPYRTAYMKGDWDIFLGQAFLLSREHHVIPPLPIPSNAPIYMTFDWGFGAPFSLLWWWVDSDGRGYLFSEWYGWNGTPNQGLRLTDPEIAQGIVEREKGMDLIGHGLYRYAGPDCFSKKPDYRGGGQGPSTAEVFASFGLHLTPGDPSRELKIRQFRERLRVLPDAPPMIQVYNTCTQFIRTIPLIQTDPNNPEYVDENGELHCFDSACHFAMARPITPRMPKKKLSLAESHIEKQAKGQSSGYEEAARIAALSAWRDLETNLPRLRGTYSDVDGR